MKKIEHFKMLQEKVRHQVIKTLLKQHLSAESGNQINKDQVK